MGILEAVIEISAEHEKNVFGEFDVEERTDTERIQINDKKENPEGVY